ncbi:hypothetical protein [Archangium sp.]|uniref:hypothetical protein n=1 Tax=Archangium sp. TaxID=1872627 RepID=UPI003899BC0A
MFELALQIHPDALAAAQPGQPGDEYELETAESQLMAACELLADAGVADFRLLCCGEQPWPVDVRTDLSVFLEQLPGLLQALREEGSCFRLRMYEQGIETVLAFTRAGGLLRIRCEPLLPGSENRWSAHDESLEVRVLVHSVAGVLAAFVQCCAHVCPPLLMHAELTGWRRLVEDQLARLRDVKP